jgi:hypothetical protein
MFTPSRVRLALAVVVLSAGLGVFLSRQAVAAASAQTAGSAPGGVTRFIEAGQCFRFVFAIPGAPDYKVRRILEGGWLETEVDAGPANAEREAVYVNTAQVVTARPRRCSS